MSKHAFSGGPLLTATFISPAHALTQQGSSPSWAAGYSQSEARSAEGTVVKAVEDGEVTPVVDGSGQIGGAAGRRAVWRPQRPCPKL